MRSQFRDSRVTKLGYFLFICCTCTMTEVGSNNQLSSDFSKLNMIQNTEINDEEELHGDDEDACTSDSSHNYLPGSYRCEKYSNVTITPTNNVHTVPNSNSNNCNSNLQIPIVGYEVMEERARFTVYKLRVENKSSGDCWYVFRRYTDFVRLCSRLKHSYPSLALLMPRKKYFGNNFDPSFLEERVQGLQAFVNAVISITDLVNSSQIQDFFCLNEPPAYSDTSDESRAIFEALEDTIYQLRHQLREKESTIDHLQTTILDQNHKFDSLNTFLRNSTQHCQKCCKDYENYKKITIKNKTDNEQSSSSDSSQNK